MLNEKLNREWRIINLYGITIRSFGLLECLELDISVGEGRKRCDCQAPVFSFNIVNKAFIRNTEYNQNYGYVTET